MNENVENLILVQLCEMRAEMTEIRADVASIKSDVKDVDQKVDGLSMILTMFAGHMNHLENRIIHLEESRGA